MTVSVSRTTGMSFMKHRLERDVTFGVAAFLNSSVVDNHFRVFSGHTQVNATDLRNMRFPPPRELHTLGKRAGGAVLDQGKVDALITRVEEQHGVKGSAIGGGTTGTI